VNGERLDGKSQEEKAEEQANLMRQGSGNYANLCGVLAGFVAVIVVLVLTPGFFQEAEASILVELVVVLFTISSIGYVFTALRFIAVSHAALWEYKSLEDMGKDFDFAHALLFLFNMIFLGGVAVLAYSRGALLMTVAGSVGFLLLLILLIKGRWALAKRPPPKKQTKTNGGTKMSNIA
jgi:hypothetical protein